MRFFSLLATAAALTFGLAAPAHAANTEAPKVEIVTKCGYLEITIVSTINTKVGFYFLAGAGSVEEVPVKIGSNVYKVYANHNDSGTVMISSDFGEGTWRTDMFYQAPEGCKVPQLDFAYTYACGGKALVKVTNTGEVPAEDMFVFRRQNFQPEPFAKRELAAGGLTFPVGTSYVLVDNLTDEFPYIMVNRNIDAGVLWPGRPVEYRYQSPAGCAEAPKVTITASCTSGVDITSTPADADLTSHVLGQAKDPERTVTERHVDLAKGEALLVTSGETVVGAFVYQGPADCTPPSSPSVGLPVTGDRTALTLGVGSGLLLLGTVALLFARRRRSGGVG